MNPNYKSNSKAITTTPQCYFSFSFILHHICLFSIKATSPESPEDRVTSCSLPSPPQVKVEMWKVQCRVDPSCHQRPLFASSNKCPRLTVLYAMQCITYSSTFPQRLVILAPCYLSSYPILWRFFNIYIMQWFLSVLATSIDLNKLNPITKNRSPIFVFILEVQL